MSPGDERVCGFQDVFSGVEGFHPRRWIGGNPLVDPMGARSCRPTLCLKELQKERRETVGFDLTFPAFRDSRRSRCCPDRGICPCWPLGCRFGHGETHSGADGVSAESWFGTCAEDCAVGPLEPHSCCYSCVSLPTGTCLRVFFAYGIWGSSSGHRFAWNSRGVDRSLPAC